MKKGLLILTVLVMVIGLQSCKKCKGEDPISRIVNNGTESVSVQIQTSGGNTVNINNILSGETSEDKSFAVGNVDFTISIGNMNDVELSVLMEECWQYEIVIDENNNVNSIPTDRNELHESVGQEIIKRAWPCGGRIPGVRIFCSFFLSY